MPTDPPERADRDELLRRLDVASRQGSVTATKLLLEELRREEDGASDGDFGDLDNVTPIRKSA
jgi:hypothetical protein